jgi:hypothetical protein
MGYQTDKANGTKNGVTNGHSNGSSNGHSNGYSNGYSNGHSNGYSNGHSNGQSNGHSNGYSDSLKENHEARTSRGEDTIELFAEAEGVSNKYKSQTQPQGNSLAVYDPATDLDPAMAKLHDKMRQLAIERQSRSGVRQKAKWALYQEKQFRRLIEDITELVDNLI